MHSTTIKTIIGMITIMMMAQIATAAHPSLSNGLVTSFDQFNATNDLPDEVDGDTGSKIVNGYIANTTNCIINNCWGVLL